jgi:hypothetical protein
VTDLLDVTQRIRQRVEAIERERQQRELSTPGETMREGTP